MLKTFSHFLIEADQQWAFANWQEKYQELIAFKEKHGHVNVPQKHPELGRWVNTQRNSYKEGKLSQERIDLLNVIGFKLDKNVIAKKIRIMVKPNARDFELTTPLTRFMVFKNLDIIFKETVGDFDRATDKFQG